MKNNKILLKISTIMTLLSILYFAFSMKYAVLWKGTIHFTFNIYILITMLILILYILFLILILVRNFTINTKFKVDKSNMLLNIGYIMALFAITFIIFAINNQKYMFPWSNNITYLIYKMYIILTISIFVLGIVIKILNIVTKK